MPSGWIFDGWVSVSDQTFEYTDTDHDHDTFSFAAASPFDNLEIVGDTSGDDVGNDTDDDTQVWQINAHPRTFRVRR